MKQTLRNIVLYAAMAASAAGISGCDSYDILSPFKSRTSHRAYDVTFLDIEGTIKKEGMDGDTYKVTLNSPDGKTYEARTSIGLNPPDFYHPKRRGIGPGKLDDMFNAGDNVKMTVGFTHYKGDPPDFTQPGSIVKMEHSK